MFVYIFFIYFPKTYQKIFRAKNWAVALFFFVYENWMGEVVGVW